MKGSAALFLQKTRKKEAELQALHRDVLHLQGRIVTSFTGYSRRKTFVASIILSLTVW